MEPKDFGRMLLRRRRTVATAMIVVAATVFFGSLRKDPQYVAACKLQFQATALDPTEDNPKSFNNTGGFQEFSDLLTSGLMAQRVADGLDLPLVQVAGKLNVSIPATSQTFDLKVVDAAPRGREEGFKRYTDSNGVFHPGERAQRICNEYGKQFIAYQLQDARKVYTKLLNRKVAQAADIRRQYRDLTNRIIRKGGEADRRNLDDVVSRDALLQTLGNITQKIAGLDEVLRDGIEGGGRLLNPAGEGVRQGADTKRALMMGLMVGLMFGVGIALVREYLDDTVRDKDSAQRELGLPVLAALPLEEEMDGFGEPSGATIEAARTLRATLASMGFPHEKSMLLVTSTLAKRRSTTLASLAAAVAESGRSVLVLGTDLRGGRTHESFGVANTVGLANVVRGQIPMEKAIRPAPGMEGVYVLPCGPIIGSPGELLSSEEMAMTLRRARRWADVVLLDAPPVLAAADSSILGAYADGVILVVSAGQTNLAQANEAKEQLVAAGARVLGAVLVGTEDTQARSENGYDDFGSMPFGGGYGSGGYDAGAGMDYYDEMDALTVTARAMPRGGARSSAPKKTAASRPGQRPKAKTQSVPRNAKTRSGSRGTVTARKPAARTASTRSGTTARKPAARKTTTPARKTTSRGTASRTKTVRATVSRTR